VLTPSAGITTKQILETFIERGASDLHLVVDRPPCYRVNGEIVSTGPVVNLTAMNTFIREISESDSLQIKLLEREEIDMTARVKISGRFYRFRVNVALAERIPFVVMRRLEDIKYSPEDLGVPEAFTRLSEERSSGIVFVTGTTGSGKSTTLASLLAKIARERACRMITLEDPIEYIIPSGKALVTQREIGWDTKSFAQALRAAMRQDPDIILVGEIRDAETAEAALTAAETGHLVFATLHVGAVSLIPQRISGFFSESPAREQIALQRLGNTFAGAMTQVLLPLKNREGRVLGWEFVDWSAASLMEENRSAEIRELMRQRGTRMADVFAQYVAAGYVDRDAAFARLNHQEEWSDSVVEEMRQAFVTGTAEMPELTLKKTVVEVRSEPENLETGSDDDDGEIFW